MRISDWSSDVCSSDLSGAGRPRGGVAGLRTGGRACECAVFRSRRASGRRPGIGGTSGAGPWSLNPLAAATAVGQADYGRVLERHTGLPFIHEGERTPATDVACLEAVDAEASGAQLTVGLAVRSEERRGGEECVSQFSYRWSPYH